MVLNKYFSIGEVFVIENALTPIFENIVTKLKNISIENIRRTLCTSLEVFDCHRKKIFVAPLPDIFASNILAYEELLKITSMLSQDFVIFVTGLKVKDKIHRNIVYTGYLSYPMYVALIISSDAAILPYPKNAICGGIRNKILEAGYCGIPIITTATGMLHLPAIPRKHYIPIEDFVNNSLPRESWRSIASEFRGLIERNYTFKVFRLSLLRVMKEILHKFSTEVGKRNAE
ncbi:glycosyltransferase [Thermoproteus tenax]|nr:glycosyltransferase [Thermoproteus tenax]